MLLTAPGIPFIYYGEEIGLEGRKPDEQIRTPMPWSGDDPAAGFSTGDPWEPLADGWETANVATEAADPASLLSTYRGSIAFRAEHPALADGGTLLVDGGPSPVIGWLRASGDETLLVVVNVGATPATDYTLALQRGPLCGVTTASDLEAVGDTTTPSAVAPTINDTGGFDAYRPIKTLQPRSGYVSSSASRERRATGRGSTAVRAQAVPSADPCWSSSHRHCSSMGSLINLLISVDGLVTFAQKGGDIGVATVVTIVLATLTLGLGLAVRFGRGWLLTVNVVAVIGFLELLSQTPVGLFFGGLDVGIVLALFRERPWFEWSAEGRAAAREAR